MNTPVKLQMACKNCGKLFTLARTGDPDDSATFSDDKEANGCLYAMETTRIPGTCHALHAVPFL